MRFSLMLGIGTGAIATYAMMSSSSDLERKVRKQSKKIMKKLQDIFD